MLRRVIVLAALAALLGTSLGMARDVKTETWNIQQDTVAQTTNTKPIGVTGYSYFSFNIEWVAGRDSANLDNHTWIIQGRVDDKVDRWRNVYVSDTLTADSTLSYPYQFTFAAYDSLVFSAIRVRFVSDAAGNGNSGDAVYVGESVDFAIHMVASRHLAPARPTYVAYEWDIDHLSRNDSAQGGWVSVAPYSEFWVFIDENIGDTLGTDSLIWRVDTRSAVALSETPFLTSYVRAVADADSSVYPIVFYFDGKDSLMFDYARIANEACQTCDTAWTDSGGDADAGLATYRVRLVGKLR